MKALPNDPVYEIVEGRPTMRTEYRIRGKRGRVALTIEMPVPSDHFPELLEVGLLIQWSPKRRFHHWLYATDAVVAMANVTRIVYVELDRLDRRFPGRVISPWGTPYLPSYLTEEEISLAVWGNETITDEEAAEIEKACREAAREARRWVRENFRNPRVD